MANEAKSISLQIDADPRLAAAVGGAARYMADSAGLDTDGTAQWQAAVVAASSEAFDSLTEDHPHLQVTLTRQSDRLEVELSHEGQPIPAVGLDNIARSASQAGGVGSANGVDRIQYEMQGNRSVTRLTKYIRQEAPSR